MLLMSEWDGIEILFYLNAETRGFAASIDISDAMQEFCQFQAQAYRIDYRYLDLV